MDNIIESNSAIAEFMGLITKEHNNEVLYLTDIYKSAEELDYNSSWDWLMPVIEKIESIGASVSIGRFFCDIGYEHPLKPEVNFHNRIACGIKMKAVYGAAVNFINWYNKSK